MEAENTRNLDDFCKSLRLRGLGLDGTCEGLGDRLCDVYPRHFSVVKMPSITVTKA